MPYHRQIARSIDVSFALWIHFVPPGKTTVMKDIGDARIGSATFSPKTTQADGITGPHKGPENPWRENLPKLTKSIGPSTSIELCLAQLLRLAF
jgi:hypothetical protein